MFLIVEGYLRKIFPVNEWLIISGKVNYFKKKCQITNPDYVTSLENKEYVVKNIPKYNLTKELTKKNIDLSLVNYNNLQRLKIG